MAVHATIPTVGELPLLGSLLAFQRDPLGLVTRVARECGDVGRFHLGPVAVLLFNTPATVHGVLVEHVERFDKGPLTLGAYGAIGQSPVLIREGAAHHRERAILNPVFDPRQLARYAGTITAYAAQAQRGWPDGAVIDAHGEMAALTLGIIGKVVLGLDALDATDGIASALAAIGDYLAHGVRTPLRVPLILPTPENLRVRRALILVRQSLQATRDGRARDGGETSLLASLYGARGRDCACLDDAAVRDDAVEMFNAGHENIAAALAWSLHLLAGHPDVAARAQQEVDAALEGHTPTYDDLARLPYTLQVVKETLRLYPPIYILSPRRALTDMAIDGYAVRKGQLILISPYAMQRRPDYYPDPDRFDPDRFSPQQEQARPDYSFLPFNAGPHGCVGNHLALTTMHLVLATLLQHVDVAPASDRPVVPQAAAVLQPAEGSRIVVRRRR